MKFHRQGLLLVLIFLPYASLIGQEIPDIGNPSKTPIEEYVANYVQASSLLETSPKKAISFALEAVYYASLTEDSLRIAKASYLAAMVYRENQRFLRSFKQFTRARNAFKSVGNEEFQLLSEWARGHSLYVLGSYQWSKEILIPIKSLVLDFFEKDMVVSFLQDLGNTHYQLGEYEEAKACYEEAYQSFNRKSREGAEFLFHLGRIQKHQGETGRAKETFQEVLEISKGLRDLRLLSLTYNDLGVILESEGKHVEAKGAYEEAIILAKNTQEKDQHQFKVQTNLAQLLLKTGETEKAHEVLTELISEGNLEDDHFRTFKAYDLLSRADQRLGNYSQLESYQDLQMEHVAVIEQEYEALEQALREEQVRKLLAGETITAQPPAEPKEHWPWWLIVLLLFIVIGYLGYRVLVLTKVVGKQRRKLEERSNRTKKMAKIAVDYHKGGPGTQVPNI